jgi:ERCC4-related helicase
MQRLPQDELHDALSLVHPSTDLVTRTHPSEKVLAFTQFADTARYLAAELRKKNLSAVRARTV